MAPKRLFLGILALIIIPTSFKAAKVTKSIYFTTVTLEAFEEDPTDWEIRTSAGGLGDQTEYRTVDGIPFGLRGSVAGSNERKCLYVKTAFARRGNNFLELVPKRKIEIPGEAQSIDIWIWGGNFRYYAEIQLEDYRGYTFSLSLGTLDYVGWRNATVKIPNYIPQSEPYIPKAKRLIVKKLVFWSDPKERTDKFYIFVDHLQVVTNLFGERFDGDDLVPIVLESLKKEED